MAEQLGVCRLLQANLRSFTCYKYLFFGYSEQAHGTNVAANVKLDVSQ